MGDSTSLRRLLVTAFFGLGISSSAWAGPDDPSPPDATEVGVAPQRSPDAGQAPDDTFRPPNRLLPIPQEAPPPFEGLDRAAEPARTRGPVFGESIKPLPLTPIPDDPPPHEGAMHELPYVIEPPDLLLVEVLEALPGRPISGERLVRPDGSISLGFYGDVHVQGLTIRQAKEKTHHASPETTPR